MINKFESGDFYTGSGSGTPSGSYGSNQGGGYYSPSPSWDSFTLLDESQAKKRFSRVFLAIFLFQIIAFALIYAAQFAVIGIFGVEEAKNILNDYTYIMIANFVAMYLIGFPILFLIVKNMRSVARTKRSMKLGELFSLFLVAEAFMYFGNVIGTYLNTFIGAAINTNIDNSIAEIVENVPMWLLIGMVIILGPIVEELIFRKLFFDKLGHYGDRLIIIVSAVSFGLFHGNLYQFFYATFVGLIFGYVYSKTANILYPIILHISLNVVGTLIPLLLRDEINAFAELSELVMSGAEYDIAEYGRITMVVGLYAVAELALIIAGTVIFFKKRKSIFVSDRCEVLIPKAKRIAVIVLNVGAILFIAFALILTALDIVVPFIDSLSESAPPANQPDVPDTPTLPDDGTNTQQPTIPGDSLIWLIKSLTP